MQALVGRTILSIDVNENQALLRFTTTSGTIIFEAAGDCCSESWFADITGADALLGSTVVTSEEISMDGYNVKDGRERQDVDEAYGYKLTTDTGIASIVFRCSSNGYYGGWVRVSTDDAAGAEWTAITDDWSA